MAEIIDWWLIIFHRIAEIMDENDYKTCTIVGPGRRWKRPIYTLAIDCDLQILKIVDKDPYVEEWYVGHNFICADAVFDEIPIEGDVLISFHGEKYYPLHYKNHIVILDTQPNKPIEGREVEGFMTSNCTTEEHFQDQNIVERYEFGGYEYMIEDQKGCDNYVLLHIKN